MNEPLRRLNFHERVSTSMWFVPGLFVAGAFLLSRLTVAVDRSLDVQDTPSWLLSVNADAAATLTATVATAMLTFLGVVFATTLVAIQLAGGQYSPRIVRVFVRSRLTHLTLGTFLATFVYALNGLVSVRDGDDPLVPAVTVSVVYLLLLATLAMFVTFLHGMAKMLRVQYLLERVTNEGRVAMLRAFPPADDYAQAAEPTAGRPVAAETLANGTRVGVLQSVDRAALVRLAEERRATVELLVEVGEYVAVATPIGRVHQGPDQAISGDDIAGCFLLGGERTLIQDPGFVLRQLVDVAIRALSPAVNDPTTAVQVIDRMVDLLAMLMPRPDPSGWYVDGAGVVRLRCREPDLERLIDLAFVEVIRYGADSPQVVRRLHAAFDVLSGLASPSALAAIDELRRVLDTTQEHLMPPGFERISALPDRHGLG